MDWLYWIRLIVFWTLVQSVFNLIGIKLFSIWWFVGFGFGWYIFEFIEGFGQALSEKHERDD